MNRIALLSLGGLFLGLSGCQSWGNYSAQSVTRVPPIGTGTYQVPGSYYGSASAPNNASANNSVPGTGAMNPASMGLPSTTPNIASTITPVSPADYSINANSNLSDPAVTTAGGTVNSGLNSNLQWQR